MVTGYSCGQKECKRMVAYWDANKQAAEPFYQHLGEPLCILFRQGIEKVSAKEVEPDTACTPVVANAAWLQASDPQGLLVLA